MLAGVLGARLNTWARERIVQTSIIASLDQETSVAAAPPPMVATPASGQDAVAVVPTATPAPAVTPTPAPINVLLLGTDERPDEGAPMRTDTMILLSLDPSGQTLGMLSMPRDLWVPIPGKNTTAKINTAYTIGSQTNYPGRRTAVGEGHSEQLYRPPGGLLRPRQL